MNRRSGQLNTPAHGLIEKYISFTRLYHSFLEERLKKTGVYRGQHQILMCISDHPGASQREIAQTYRVSPATIAVSLKKLEKGGYIKRDVDEGDNRYNQIRTTEMGEKLVSESRRLFQDVEETLFRDFTEEDFRVMDGYFERMQSNLAVLINRGEREEHQ